MPTHAALLYRASLASLRVCGLWRGLHKSSAPTQKRLTVKAPPQVTLTGVLASLADRPVSGSTDGNEHHSSP